MTLLMALPMTRDWPETHHHTIKNDKMHSMYAFQTPVLCNLTLPLLSIVVYRLLRTTMQHQGWSTKNHGRVPMKICRQNCSCLETVFLLELTKQRLCSILLKVCTMKASMPFLISQNLFQRLHIHKSKLNWYMSLSECT